MSEQNNQKTETLALLGVLNPRPDRVRDPLFHGIEFFDARDLVQVKYEMLRRVQIEKASIREAAATFGFSRPSFYQAQVALERDGLAGLIPRRPGPRRAHKLSDEIVAALLQERVQRPDLTVPALAGWLFERFEIAVHRRSVERALKRGLKKVG